MHDRKSDAERLAGADAITSRAKELANELGIHIIECIWDEGREMADRDSHLLEILTEDRSISGSFSDEQLADYQGKVGTERTEATLGEMIRSLLG
jgi:hypothetical protein